MLEKIEEIYNLVVEIHERGKDKLKDKFVWRKELKQDQIPFLSDDHQIKEAIDSGWLTPLQERNQVYLLSEVEAYIDHKIKEIGRKNGRTGQKNDAPDQKGPRKSMAGKKKSILDTLTS